MKPKLTIEHGVNGLLKIRHGGHVWEIFPNRVDVASPQDFAWMHRTPSGVWDREFHSTVETEKKLLDLITQRLKLSDFWNGQTAFPFTK